MRHVKLVSTLGLLAVGLATVMLAGCGGGGGGGSTTPTVFPFVDGVYKGTFVDGSGTFHTTGAGSTGALVFNTVGAFPRGSLSYPDGTTWQVNGTWGPDGQGASHIDMDFGTVGSNPVSMDATGHLVADKSGHYAGVLQIYKNGVLQSQTGTVDVTLQPSG